MSIEKSAKPNYEILAYITRDKERVISGNALAIYVKTEEEQKELTLDIAKALKADVTELSNGDFIVLRV